MLVRPGWVLLCEPQPPNWLVTVIRGAAVPRLAARLRLGLGAAAFATDTQEAADDRLVTVGEAASLLGDDEGLPDKGAPWARLTRRRVRERGHQRDTYAPRACAVKD